MKRSDERILTTHVGALPRPQELGALVQAKTLGGDYDEAKLAEWMPRAVEDVVRQQLDAGVDIINDGEYGKTNWTGYIGGRLGGYEHRDLAPGEASGSGTQAGIVGRDRRAFEEFYQDYDANTMRLRRERAGDARNWQINLVNVGPVSYTGHAAIASDVGFLKAAVGARQVADVFMPSIGPDNVIPQSRYEFYPGEWEYVYAVAEAMREEYKAITDAGYILQIDAPVGKFETQDMTLEAFRARFARSVEALNHALEGIPEEQVRFHLCFGSWHGPHAFDLELKDVVDLVLQVNAQAYSVEAANPRHEHEWKVWRDTKLPDGKILMPGVVTHSTNTIEHPELVADRIERIANVVGRENVVASTDCGLGARVHPQIAWAKLRTLSEGAHMASERLWG
ncbi:MAG: cobalamin-independent methionine synthase II family protein [Chloroflexota bacterium]|nr:cobalamin-independent methionine synthase II family protein [Chloroflexota bacterium]